MTRQKNDEDLFENTRMSFGEHLEELRRVLFRALIGVAIGVTIGLWYGDRIIAVLSKPLGNAIAKFNKTLAKKDLEKEIGYVPPEFEFWFDKGLVPQRALFSPADLRDAMSGNLQPKNQQLAADEFQFTRSDFPASSVARICRRLTTLSGDESTGLLDFFTADERTVIASVAAGSESEFEIARFIQAFNRVLDEPELNALAIFVAYQKTETSWLNLTPPDTAGTGFEMKRKLSEKFDERLNRQLNRYLVHRYFIDDLEPLKSELVPINIWRPINTRAQSLSITEPFMIWLKAGGITGLFLASPWVFYQIWTFVAAGLYRHEQKYVYLYMPISLGLFFSGILLAYFFVFDPVLQFLFSFNAQAGIDPQPRINDWLGFVLLLPLGFGLSFQLPLVMLFLNRIGVIEISQYLSKWRIAIMVIFVVSMILTPADPISMLMMAVPLTFLYFFGIGLCQWMPGHRNPFAEEAT